jgi:uncharacterized phage protein gp47/JayE
MYEGQTYEVILKRMLDKLPSDVDKREGSVAYDLLAPKAAEMAVMYIEMDNVLKYGFVDTTYGPFLDSKVLEVGIVREPAQKAIGSVKFTGPNGTVILQGSIVTTNNGIRFITDNVATISGGTVTIPVTAETAGVVGNVAANSIVKTSISGVTCTNLAPTLNGSDIETDAALLARYLKQVRTPSVSGNIFDYYDWALEIDGIGDARVVPIWNGPGTVKVILIDSNKQPVTPEKVTEVYNNIELKRPIGASVSVGSALSKAINVSAKLTLQSDQTLAAVLPLATESITNYLKEAAFVDLDIKFAKIGSLLLQIAGVIDYQNLTLNGSASNVPLTDSEVAVIGTVTLT